MIYREDGQHSSNDLRGRDFRRELEDRERTARDKRSGRDRGIYSIYNFIYLFIKDAPMFYGLVLPYYILIWYGKKIEYIFL